MSDTDFDRWADELSTDFSTYLTPPRVDWFDVVAWVSVALIIVGYGVFLVWMVGGL